MGELIRNYNWASTLLGAPSNWPSGLKTSVRLLLSTGHPMFIWWGPEHIQFYNDAYRRSIGPEMHPKALGQSGKECWREIWPIIGPQIEQVMNGDGCTWNENHLVPITRNGHLEDVYWTYSYSPIDEPESPSGVGGVLVVCSETTNHVMTQQRLQKSDQRWRALFEQTPGFMCILTGPEHTFEFANPSYFKLIGNRDIIGKTVREAIPEVQSQDFIDLLDSVYWSGKSFSGVAKSLILHSELPGVEQEVFLDFVYQPLHDENDKIFGIFVAGNDVTERIHFSEHLKIVDRRKDEFLAMLAHELRNPLAPLRNIGDILLQTSVAGTRNFELSQILTRQVNQLVHLVDDLLDISRVTQGAINLKKDYVNVQSIIHMAIDSLQSQIEERHHSVNFDCKDAELCVFGDMTRLVQCVSNLLANAIKYTPEHGEINIELSQNNELVSITVTDNGVGMEPEMISRAFELFSQADKTLDRSQGGLGIGLSIVQKLVQMHRGVVTASSKGLGYGCKFEIQIPLVENVQAPIPIPAQSVNHAQNILIVDDNQDAANTLGLLLGLNDHAVECVYSGEEALLRLQTFTPNIILLDIGLPGMDGYEVARCIRATNKNVVLIAVTGYGQEGDRKRAIDVGFNHHLTKPVVLSELENLLRENLLREDVLRENVLSKGE